MARLLKWRSPTIIEMEDDVNNREEKFPPVHPGEILLEDFLKPSYSRGADSIFARDEANSARPASLERR